MFRRRESLVSAKSGRTDRGIRGCLANAVFRPHIATSNLSRGEIYQKGSWVYL